MISYIININIYIVIHTYMHACIRVCVCELKVPDLWQKRTSRTVPLWLRTCMSGPITCFPRKWHNLQDNPHALVSDWKHGAQSCMWLMQQLC